MVVKAQTNVVDEANVPVHRSIPTDALVKGHALAALRRKPTTSARTGAAMLARRDAESAMASRMEPAFSPSLALHSRLRSLRASLPEPRRSPDWIDVTHGWSKRRER
jgi:hypothetical protein